MPSLTVVKGKTLKELTRKPVDLDLKGFYQKNGKIRMFWFKLFQKLW